MKSILLLLSRRGISRPKLEVQKQGQVGEGKIAFGHHHPHRGGGGGGKRGQTGSFRGREAHFFAVGQFLWYYYYVHSIREAGGSHFRGGAAPLIKPFAGENGGCCSSVYNETDSFFLVGGNEMGPAGCLDVVRF